MVKKKKKETLAWGALHQGCSFSYFFYTDSNLKQKRKGRQRSIPGGELEPEINNPDLFCCSCKKTYSTKNEYRRHLKHIHKMQLKSLRPLAVSDDILPDWNDSNYHCQPCDRSYSSAPSYHAHCKRVHKMEALTRPPEDPSANDVSNYCKICDRSYTRRLGYIAHCMLVHGNEPKPAKRFANADATPDPNNYCKECEKTFCDDHSFKSHLSKIHSIVSSSANNSGIAPDIDDPNLYCQSCDMKLSTSYNYRVHLTAIHFIGQVPSSKNKAHPDVNDPNYYCRVCQQTYSTKQAYRTHLQAIHRLILNRKKDVSKRVHQTVLNPRSTVSNPRAKIDIHDPDYYCAKCEHRYANKSSFACHLLAVHLVKIWLSPCKFLSFSYFKVLKIILSSCPYKCRPMCRN